MLKFGMIFLSVYTEVLLCIGIDCDESQDNEQERLHEVVIDKCQDSRTDKCHWQCDRTHDRKMAEVQRNMPGVFICSKTCPGERRKFRCTDNRCDRILRKHDKTDGYLNESAAADHSINEAGDERRCGEDKYCRKFRQKLLSNVHHDILCVLVIFFGCSKSDGKCNR